MQKDQRGLAMTTDSGQAAQHFSTAIDRYFEYRLDTMQHVKAALAADPDFVMGHCLRGYLFMLFGTTTVYDKVREALAFCEPRAASVTPREALHIRALRAWLEGDLVRAVALWDEILFDSPHDLLALRLQHFTLFWMGNNYALRNGVAKVFDAWEPGLPGYGNVLGMLAFGQEECGDYEQAERHGRAAVEANPEDLWAIHAVAHVLEMQGRMGEGLHWLDYPADCWEDRNPFRGHLWWHRALFAHERGDYDQALDLYDRSIRSERSDFYLDIQNAAALLLRLEFQGVGVGDRWAELADHAETHIDDHALAFTDLHCMMSLAREGRREAAERYLASLRTYAEEPNNYEAATMAPLTIPLCEALLAYADRAYDRAVEILLPLRDRLSPVGGSHAQRDVFVQLLLESAIRAGRLSLARALLSERITVRPASHGNWVKYGTVMESLGDRDAAEAARARAGEIAQS